MNKIQSAFPLTAPDVGSSSSVELHPFAKGCYHPARHWRLDSQRIAWMFQRTYLIDKPLAEGWGDPFSCMNATVHKNSLSSFILPPNLLKKKSEVLFYMSSHTDPLLLRTHSCLKAIISPLSCCMNHCVCAYFNQGGPWYVSLKHVIHHLFHSMFFKNFPSCQSGF